MSFGFVRIVTAMTLLLSGCSAIINPDDSRLIGGGGGRDAGPPTRVDAGTPGTCTGTASRCVGDTLVRCVGGMEVFEICPDNGAYCQSGACRGWVCVPGTRRCNATRTASEVCTARGDRVDVTPCTGGSCNLATGLCEDGPVGCAGLPTIAPGMTRTVDLCEREDQNDPLTDGFADCPGGLDANLGDAVFELTIETPGTYEITLADVEPGTSIDTVLYLRSACDQPSSQLACADDSSCALPGFPDDSCRAPSILTELLDRGVYYVVVDGYRYMGTTVAFDCGVVQLSVRSRATDP